MPNSEKYSYFTAIGAKKATIALKEDKPAEPYHSGPGCVGKSHVIKWIYSDTLKSYIHAYTQYTALVIQIHT